MELNKEQLLQTVASVFIDKMPFNQLLGLEITRYEIDDVEVRFRWQDKFIGNPHRRILHGGVTAAVLDVAGGLIAIGGIIERVETSNPAAFAERIKNVGTIDLRTDFLRPGIGEEFIATAKVIRAGNKVCVCRMELHNETGVHIAFGTGTYLVE